MAAVKWMLALDIGEKKTGIAVGQTLTQSAKPLTVIRQPIESLHAKVFLPWVKEWAVTGIIIGLPVLKDGKDHPLKLSIERIATECQQEFHLPVYFVDEYLSSHEAAQRTPDGKNLDAFAAAVIAEDWLASTGKVE